MTKKPTKGKKISKRTKMPTPPQEGIITAAFLCRYESHDRRTFQGDGHFVPGLTDSSGARRQWNGNLVHIVQLFHSGEQILRVLSDSYESAAAMMADRIVEHFSAMALREKIVELDAIAYQRTKLERDLLVGYMKANRLTEQLAEILGTSVVEIDREMQASKAIEKAVEGLR